MSDIIVFSIQIFFLLFFFFLNVILSATETSLIALSRPKIVMLIEKHPSKSKGLKIWLNDPNRMLTTIIIGVNIAIIGTSTIGALLAAKIAKIYNLNEWVMGIISGCIITIVMIVVGEIVPKIFAIRNPERITLLIIKPLTFVDNAIYPLARSITNIANKIIKIFGGNPVEKISITTTEEIKTLIRIGAEEGVIHKDEKEMIHSIFDFGDTTVKDVMVPKQDMVCVNINDNINKILETIVEEGFSRLPVYKGNIDNIVGLLYSKDLLSIWKYKKLVIMQDIIREPYFINENKKVQEILKEFQKGKIHIAIVLDTYGKTVGLVTLEDLIEEIVGEIKDEYDI